MILPLNSKPRLSQGCNLSQDVNQKPVILIPEGIIKLQGTGLEILRCCDGKRTLDEIIILLQEKYKIDSKVLKDEVQTFLTKLVEKKIVSIE